MQSTPNQTLTSVIIWIVIVGLVIYRVARPQRFTIARLFVMPVLLLALTALAVWGNAVAAAQLGAAPAPPYEIALALLVGAILGVPLGVLRGRHSDVRVTERPGEMFVHSSPLVIILWVAVFALRSLIRYFLPHAGAFAAAFGDGLMAFAVAALITSYVVIYQRYKSLTAAQPSVQQGAS